MTRRGSCEGLRRRRRWEISLWLYFYYNYDVIYYIVYYGGWLRLSSSRDALVP